MGGGAGRSVAGLGWREQLIVAKQNLFFIVKYTLTKEFMSKYLIHRVLTIFGQCLADPIYSKIRILYLQYQYNSLFMSNTLLKIKIVFLNFNHFLSPMVATVVCYG